MKLPRDVSASRLIKALRVLGYSVDHQRGSHVRIVAQLHGRHHETIPAMELDHQTLEQSAITATNWGVLPVVSVNAMRQAFLGNASRIVAVGEAFRVLWRDHRRSHHTASRDKQSIP
jgi:predicted RNA binding protein YcfA (HicA-like mRNA interferase family)